MEFRENASPSRGTYCIVEKVVVDSDTEFGNIKIFDNNELGRVLVIDGAVQLATVDEYIYHEMMAHTAMFSCSGVGNVLIIGGADGGILREVTKHSVSAVEVVDISDAVRAVCAEHLPEVAGGAFEDPRASFICADGAQHVAAASGSYDVIIVDGTDARSAPSLYTEAFYGDCKRLLGNTGVLITHSGCEVFDAHSIADHIARLRKAFAHVEPLDVATRYFPGASLVLLAASGVTLRQFGETNDPRTKAVETRYYSSEMRRLAVESCALRLAAFTR
jgi:spermidine synthase